MRYLVIGAGISGLAAGWELTQHVDGSDITVLDAWDRPGGKLRSMRAGRVDADVGAESVLVGRPEAVELIHEVGLGKDLVHPSGGRASLWSRGALQPVPSRTLLGVPADLAGLGALLTPAEVARIRAEVVDTLDARDVSVGQLVADRLGDALVDRLVEPLLGEVYAGHAHQISAAAATPELLRAAQAGESLVDAAARAVSSLAPGTGGPPLDCAGIDGGLHRLPTALAHQLKERGVTLAQHTIVRELHRTHHGWRAVSGPVPSPRAHETDRVILAVPPAPTARLLAQVAPVAAQALSTVEMASVTVLTFAFPADEMPELPGSGLLVPHCEGRFLRTVTFSATTWDWVRERGVGASPDGRDVLLLRASVGRHGEEYSLQYPDRVLLERALSELALAVGRSLPAPLDTHVQRWGGGLPQYAVGHLDLVATVREAVTQSGGLMVAGAAYDGVGIPACIASGRTAARAVLAG